MHFLNKALEAGISLILGIDISRFHDGLILFQFDTIAPNLVPSVSNDLVQLREWE